MSSLGWIRSALFVPGNRPDRIDKAIKTKADMVIIDLEDAVPISEKDVARKTVAEKLGAIGDHKVIVRTNGISTPFFTDDLEAVMVPGIKGLIIPKLNDVESMDRLHEQMCTIELQRSMPITPVIIMIESAKAVANIHRIACFRASPARLHSFAFGAADYTNDLGISISEDGRELIYPRSRIAVASRAADMPPPLDTPYMENLKDMQALEKDALRAKQLGFGGKLCIHPDQIEIVNRIFSPSAEEVQQAQKIVDVFEEARKKGIGVIQIDGKFIDKPVFERAKQILASRSSVSV
ncbi:MAG: CoA ester lyase [Desulfatitalea sp.]|nr:CoA ester lyase [Desulfatitalea sp.]